MDLRAGTKGALGRYRTATAVPSVNKTEIETDSQLDSSVNESTQPKSIQTESLVEVQSQEKYPIILSFDVGVIHLAYCLMTKKEYMKPDGTKKLDWRILDWNNIDVTNRDEQKCHCGAKAKLSNMVDGIMKYLLSKEA